jgi:predicted helicase
MEGGKIFGAGSRASVAITLLVKDGTRPSDGVIHYHEVGDYLTRDDKLLAVHETSSMENIPWRVITPNDQGDWINMRDPAFAKFMALGDKDDDKTLRLFDVYSLGVVTNRDPWAVNFSRAGLADNMSRMIAFYNAQREAYAKTVKAAKGEAPTVEDVIDHDPKKISWTRSLKGDVRKQKVHAFQDECIVDAAYRPFCKQRLYFSRRFNEMVYQIPRLFPTPAHQNVVISTTGVADRKGFSCLIANSIPSLHLTDTGQCFPRYYYDEAPKADLLSQPGNDVFVRRDAISDAALAAFRKTYADDNIGKEDLFHYVYGILHSPEYKTRFEADLKKQLPRVPFARDFWAFSKAGLQLAYWHLNYETIEPWPLQQAGKLDLGNAGLYRVEKMAWGRKRVDGKQTSDKTTLVYNSHYTLVGIPPEALDYVVNGKPALEWIIERYQVTTDKDSRIVNDPNNWAIEHDDPAYILNLIKRVVRVSVETARIVKALPALDEMKPQESATYRSGPRAIARVAEQAPLYGVDEEQV